MDEVVGYGYDVGGVFRVGYRVAEGAAGGGPFCAVDVAEAVAGGGGEEGDVYFDGALFDGAGAAAVASDDDGDVYFAAGEEFAQFAADAGGVESADESAFYVVGDAVVGVGYGAGGEGEVFEAHRLEFG